MAAHTYDTDWLTLRRPPLLCTPLHHYRISRQICEAAVASPMYKSVHKLPIFKPPQDGSPLSLGKIYDITISRQLLGNWQAKHSNFASYMATMKPSTSSASSR